MCLASSGCCPIVVTVALGVTIGHSLSLYIQKGAVDCCNWGGDVRPIQWSAKKVDVLFPPKLELELASVEREREREEGG